MADSDHRNNEEKRSTARTPILGYAAAAVAAAVLAGAVFYMLGAAQGERKADRAKQAAAESREEADELRKEISELSDALEELQRSTSTTLPPSRSDRDSREAKPKAEAESSYTRINDAYVSGGKRMINADYVQLLSGEAAAKARIASGDCSGTVAECMPDNDYYIANTNPRIRTLTLSPSAVIEREVPGTKDPDGSLGEAPLAWSTLQSRHPLGKSTTRDLELYKVTVEDGVVTTLTLIYLP